MDRTDISERQVGRPSGLIDRVDRRASTDDLINIDGRSSGSAEWTDEAYNSNFQVVVVG